MAPKVVSIKISVREANEFLEFIRHGFVPYKYEELWKMVRRIERILREMRHD